MGLCRIRGALARRSSARLEFPQRLASDSHTSNPFILDIGTVHSNYKIKCSQILQVRLKSYTLFYSIAWQFQQLFIAQLPIYIYHTPFFP